jgi:hypothetical protein
LTKFGKPIAGGGPTLDRRGYCGSVNGDRPKKGTALGANSFTPRPKVFGQFNGALVAAQLDREMQCIRLVPRHRPAQTGHAVGVGPLALAGRPGRRRGLAEADGEEALARPVGEEVGVAQLLLGVEMILLEVGAQQRRRRPQLALHVADALELPERLQPGHERLRDDDHDEQGQRHRDEHFDQREGAASMVHDGPLLLAACQ